MVELDPCPFCGNEDIALKSDTYDYYNFTAQMYEKHARVFIKCTLCQTSMLVVEPFECDLLLKLTKRTIERWNTRVPCRDKNLEEILDGE